MFIVILGAGVTDFAVQLQDGVLGSAGQTASGIHADAIDQSGYQQIRPRDALAELLRR